jgi:hypothetical protein
MKQGQRAGPQTALNLFQGGNHIGPKANWGISPSSKETQATFKGGRMKGEEINNLHPSSLILPPSSFH